MQDIKKISKDFSYAVAGRLCRLLSAPRSLLVTFSCTPEWFTSLASTGMLPYLYSRPSILIFLGALVDRLLVYWLQAHTRILFWQTWLQAEMPSKSGRNLTGQLRSLGSRTHRDFPHEPFQASSTLCMLLNDLREIRSRQADLSGLLRGMVDAQWWGSVTQGSQGQSSKLGDRFKVCQVSAQALQHIFQLDALLSQLTVQSSFTCSNLPVSLKEAVCPSCKSALLKILTSAEKQHTALS